MPASPRLVRHTSESKERALRPATMSAGPSIPRVAISRPRDEVAFFPWVYRAGEQKMDNMCLLYCIAIEGCTLIVFEYCMAVSGLVSLGYRARRCYQR